MYEVDNLARAVAWPCSYHDPVHAHSAAVLVHPATTESKRVHVLKRIRVQAVRFGVLATVVCM